MAVMTEKQLEAAISQRLYDYCDERNWQKLRQWEMAEIAMQVVGPEIRRLRQILVDAGHQEE